MTWADGNRAGCLDDLRKPSGVTRNRLVVQRDLQPKGSVPPRAFPDDNLQVVGVLPVQQAGAPADQDPAETTNTREALPSRGDSDRFLQSTREVGDTAR